MGLSPQQVKLRRHLLPTVDRDNVKVGELGDSSDLSGNLNGELTRGHQADRLKPSRRVQILQHGNRRRSRLPGPRAGLTDDVLTLKRRWDHVSLDIARLHELHLVKGFEEADFNAKIGEGLG